MGKTGQRILIIVLVAITAGTVSLAVYLGVRTFGTDSAVAEAEAEKETAKKEKKKTKETAEAIGAAEAAETEAAGEAASEAGNGGKETAPETAQSSGIQTLLTQRDRLRSASPAYTPENIPASVIEPDPGTGFSGVDNWDQYMYLSEKAVSLLEQNHFFVDSRFGYDEFYTVYEDNRYWNRPNFVTVDSLMHTYHLYFSLLMKNTERDYVAPELLELSRKMTERSRGQLAVLQGTEWESAALRNLAFFTVGCRLQDPETEIDPRVAETVNTEYDRIMAAEGRETCSLFPEVRVGDFREEFKEDYSQYKPRGNYAGNPELEAYFRAMMWYGRISFLADDEDSTRSALLITLALDGERAEAWEKIYTVTSFFAGASDDNTYYDYTSVLSRVYHEGVTAGELAGGSQKFEEFMAEVSMLEAPKINSLLKKDGGAEETASGRCFRFMGQRYCLDGEIYERLTEYPERKKPDALDVPAALGSEAAEEILTEQGDALTGVYRKELPVLKEEITERGAEIWSGSLSAGWLSTLTPLLEAKGTGYPLFMQNREWERKTLETFEGSYAELKHDTVLYAKQLYVAEGDGEEPEPRDDRGYVEPEPEVYARFASLSAETRDGLARYGMLTAGQEARLDELTELAAELMRISEKELADQTLTEEQYQLIRDYGRTIEGFWENYIEDKRADNSDINDYSPALVTDIAGGDDWTLNIATGDPQKIFVLVPVDGSLRIATGTVYSFYEFTTGAGERLTDGEWKDKMGFNAGLRNDDLYDPVDQPAWTQGYRLSDW